MRKLLTSERLRQGLDIQTLSGGAADDEADLWATSDGWDDANDEVEAGETPLMSGGEDVSMETWVIMELCTRGSLPGTTKRW